MSVALDSTVKVKFLGDAANLAREAARASKATDAVGKSAENAHKHLSSMAKGLIAGASVGAALVGVERAVRSSVNAYKDAAAEASKLSRLTGLAAQDASRLGFAAKETGVDTDTFSKALGILSKNLNNADKAQTVLTKTHHLAIEQVPRLVKGHLEYVAQLKNVTDVSKTTVAGTQSLGFALRDASGHLLPMSKLLPEIADKFKNMADGPEKTALALKLFGRGGAALLPFLNKGAEGIAALNEEADKLGITMSEKDVAAYRANVAAQRQFKAAMDGIKISLGRELFPLFAQWTTLIADNAPKINEMARSFTGKLVPAVEATAGAFRDLYEGYNTGKNSGFGEAGTAAGRLGDGIQKLGSVFRVVKKILIDFEYGLLGLAQGILDVVGSMAHLSDKFLHTHFSSGIDDAITKIKTLQGDLAATAAGVTIPVNVVITEQRAPLAPAQHAKGFIGPTVAEGLAKQGVTGPYTPAQTGATAVAKQVAQAAVDAAAATKAAADKTAAANKAALDKELATAATAQRVADAKQAAAAALQKATDALRGALQSRLDTAKGIRDSLISSNSVIREGVSFTSKDLLSRFMVTVAKVKRFQAAITEMVRKHFSPELVQQSAQAGVGNLGAVEALARSSAGQVRQFNAAQTSINRAAGVTGDRVASQAGPIVNVYIDGKQIAANVITKHNQALATAVNSWNAKAGYNGSRLAG